VKALSAEEIDELLGEVHHGRLGLSTPEGVYVVPVGFVWAEGSIWFHSGPGRKASALEADARCVFEVDRYDRETADWASVIFTGRAAPESSPAAMASMKARFGHVLSRVLSSGLSTGRGQLYRLTVESLSGRKGP
jgi:nitroimidazol reductase NimA-like FMN-containing flavoprotein (pyridoxamine 5'-phosphate oxidase superfamily)